MQNIIDISVPLSPTLPVWTGEKNVEISQTASIRNGDDANVTSMRIGSHTGTHIDAPLHFIDGGKTTNEIPLDRLVGTCQVLDLCGKSEITADDLQKIQIQPGIKKLLFKTDNSKLWDNPGHKFYLDFCALTAGAAQWVVDHNFHLTGIDYLSIQRYYDPFDTHVILLSNEVVIVENLDLRNVRPGVYKLTCLPLKIEGVEGTLARAILERF